MTPEQFHWLMQGFAIDPVIHDVTPGIQPNPISFVQYSELFPLYFAFFFQVLYTAFRDSISSFTQSPKLCVTFSFIVASLHDQLSSMQTQLDTANKQLSDTNRQIELLTEQIRIMNQREFERQAESGFLGGQLTLFAIFEPS